MPHDGISNPILNSPFAEPNRFHAFDEDGITNTVEHGRRPSSYFVPIAQPRKRTKPPLRPAQERHHRGEGD